MGGRPRERIRAPGGAACAESSAGRAPQERRHLPETRQPTGEIERCAGGADEVARRLLRSGLAADKTIDTLVRCSLPLDVRRQIPTLCRGDFVRHRQNVVALGPSASGKTHLLSAIGRELIARGFTVLFVPVHRFLDRLLLAEQALDIERELRRLDAYDVVLLDDIGAVPQRPQYGRLLLALVARRYERRSTMVTSGLPFARWDRIFHDRAIVAATLDRLVHHATILQLTGRCCRGPRRACGPLPHESRYRRVGVASPELIPSAEAPAEPKASR